MKIEAALVRAMQRVAKRHKTHGGAEFYRDACAAVCEVLRDSVEPSVELTVAERLMQIAENIDTKTDKERIDLLVKSGALRPEDVKDKYRVTTDALEIIDARFFDGKPEMQALLKQTEAEEAAHREGYGLGYEAGIEACAEYCGLSVKEALRKLRLGR